MFCVNLLSHVFRAQLNSIKSFECVAGVLGLPEAVGVAAHAGTGTRDANAI